MKNTYLFAFLFFTNMAFAQAPLLIEDFNYTAGDLLTDHGWTSHSGGTTNPILVTSPGLTFNGYVGSNTGFSAGVNNTGQDVIKSFGAQSTGTVYTSFLVKASASTAAGVYFFHYLQTSGSSAHRARTFISAAPDVGKMFVGLTFNSATAANSQTVLNFDQTYLMVVKYEIVDGTDNDKVSLYVFAEGDNFTSEPTAPFLGPVTGTAVDITPTYVVLRQDEAVQRITVDGFRVKKHWQLNADDPSSTINPDDNSDLKHIYPNPVTDGVLNIVSNSTALKQITVFDYSGRKVLETTVFSNRVDVSKLTAGVYMLKLNADNQSVYSKFIVK